MIMEAFTSAHGTSNPTPIPVVSIFCDGGQSVIGKYSAVQCSL